MQLNLKLPNYITIAFLMSLSSCGIDQEPRWKDKNFGELDQSAPETNLPLPPPDRQLPPEADPETPEPNNQLLSYFGFNGYFNLDTIHRITRGTDEINGEVSEGGVLDNLLSKIIGTIIGENTRETLSLMTRRNGEGRNSIQQVGTTEGGDKIAAIKGDESQSGIQFLDWVLGNSKRASHCPTPFICIDRMVWSPASGSTMTFCYRDPDTKERIAIPYSVNPHFSSESFANAIGRGIQSKPFEVVSHPGNVSCDETQVETRDVRLVIYKLTLGALGDQRRPGFLKKAIHRPLSADTEVILNYSLYHPTMNQPYLPKRGPYIDQMTRLNSRMKFFINDAEHVMVKIERTVQSPLKFEGSKITDFFREAYGEWTGDAVAQVFPSEGDTEGAQMVYTFEFCTHLGVVKNPFNHCTGRVEP
jgi:hypothetical protein